MNCLTTFLSALSVTEQVFMTQTSAVCAGETRINPAANKVFAIDEDSAKLSLQPKVKNATVFGSKMYQSKKGGAKIKMFTFLKKMF